MRHLSVWLLLLPPGCVVSFRSFSSPWWLVVYALATLPSSITQPFESAPPTCRAVVERRRCKYTLLHFWKQNKPKHAAAIPSALFHSSPFIRVEPHIGRPKARCRINCWFSFHFQAAQSILHFRFAFCSVCFFPFSLSSPFSLLPHLRYVLSFLFFSSYFSSFLPQRIAHAGIGCARTTRARATICSRENGAVAQSLSRLQPGFPRLNSGLCCFFLFFSSFLFISYLDVDDLQT